MKLNKWRTINVNPRTKQRLNKIKRTNKNMHNLDEVINALIDANEEAK